MSSKYFPVIAVDVLVAVFNRSGDVLLRASEVRDGLSELGVGPRGAAAVAAADPCGGGRVLIVVAVGEFVLGL